MYVEVRSDPSCTLYTSVAFVTFSTFSAEIVANLEEGRALWACGAAALHLAGSVLMTFAGIGTVAWVKG